MSDINNNGNDQNNSDEIFDLTLSNRSSEEREEDNRQRAADEIRWRNRQRERNLEATQRSRNKAQQIHREKIRKHALLSHQKKEIEDELLRRKDLYGKDIEKLKKKLDVAKEIRKEARGEYDVEMKENGGNEDDLPDRLDPIVYLLTFASSVFNLLNFLHFLKLNNF